jgi:glycosyltransferase involved in cell wall biosynthesis
VIHIVNPMWNAFGGSEQRVGMLYSTLRARGAVDVWSELAPDRRWTAKIPVRRIDANQQPLGGTLVVVGVYFRLGPWLATAHPRRVILVVNTLTPGVHAVALDLAARTGRKVEIVYASEALRVKVGLPGHVEPSPIDTRRFTRPRRPRGEASFVVGRLSRDVPEKHDPVEDPKLYAELVRQGCTVRIMGGTHLSKLGCPPEVELLREGVRDAADFLHDLDCFVYRTHPAWFETFGRVIVEAMAAGLPVVAHASGGYLAMVRHGETGLVFRTTDEAVRHILRLRDEVGLAAQLGDAAMREVERTYGQGYWERLTDFYFGEHAAPAP